MKSLIGITFVIGLVVAISGEAEELLVEHLDELVIDDRLTLSQVVDTTFERYPQNALISAFQEESKALEQRSSSWIAGYPMIYLQYIDDALLGRDDGITNVQSGYQVPLWMWGQKEASQKITEESKQAAEHYIHALKHEVAGLVRDSLWTLRLMENRRELSRQIYEVAEKLTAVVRRRVELGDLARADELLAESDQLEKKTAWVQAEAEVMHARKAYQNLTRMNRAPKRLEEMLSNLKGLDERHPSLAASGASVERAQAEVEFTRLSKQGNQPTILVGTDSTQIERQGRFGTGTNIVLQIPIGGDDWHAPQVAQANLTLNEKIVQRETLRRQLEKALHEAQHNLAVDRAALEIAERRKAIAETQISMSRIAFEAGEIALIDYLKIQAGAQSAIRDAAERAILVQKDTSVYNQVVGVMP
jgi:outer membrane protein, heavy metal efflux system